MVLYYSSYYDTWYRSVSGQNYTNHVAYNAGTATKWTNRIAINGRDFGAWLNKFTLEQQFDDCSRSKKELIETRLSLL